MAGVHLFIVTLTGPGHKQRIANNDLSGNQDGAFKFQNAGELNPSVIVEQNRIQDGGVKILNLTGPHVVDMFIQNSRLLTIANNYIARNYGGMLVNATTNSITTAVYANITNNVIMHNSHGSIMHMEGRTEENDPFGAFKPSYSTFAIAYVLFKLLVVQR